MGSLREILDLYTRVSFCDSVGTYLGAFLVNLAIVTSFQTELTCIVLPIEHTSGRR